MHLRGFGWAFLVVDGNVVEKSTVIQQHSNLNRLVLKGAFDKGEPHFHNLLSHNNDKATTR
jgi:hypothetical protein